jgi:hypothetical protein
MYIFFNYKFWGAQSCYVAIVMYLHLVFF